MAILSVCTYFLKGQQMRKALFTTIFATSLIGSSIADAADTKSLPQPDLNQSSPTLMQLLNNRQSMRSFATDKMIDNQTLSEILWVANGMKENGKRTIPTARNQQNLKVFLLQTDGIWYYNAQDNQLEKISDENAIAAAGSAQPYSMEAPVHLIYTSSDAKWGKEHAGSAYQDVYLYATAKGLATVIRGMVDEEALHKALKLDDEEFVIAHQPVGYPK